MINNHLIWQETGVSLTLVAFQLRDIANNFNISWRRSKLVNSTFIAFQLRETLRTTKGLSLWAYLVKTTMKALAQMIKVIVNLYWYKFFLSSIPTRLEIPFLKQFDGKVINMELINRWNLHEYFVWVFLRQ